MVYPGMARIEQELDRLPRRCRPSGYTTCAWHTVRTALILFDRSGWFARPGPGATAPPPAAPAIISHNLPILRGSFPATAITWEIHSPGATWCLSTMR